MGDLQRGRRLRRSIDRPQWKKRAKARAAALAPTLSTLTIVVPHSSEVDGLEVFRDGTKMPRGVKVPVDGGDHEIVGRAPGHEAWTKHVDVPARDGALSVTVPPLVRSPVASVAEPSLASAEPAARADAPASERTAAAAPSPESRGDTQRVLGITTAAVGLVGVGVGTFFGIRAMGKHDDAGPNCSADESRCSPQGLIDYRDAVSAANTSTVSFVIGGILVATGVVLYLVSPRSRSSATSHTSLTTFGVF